jgi:hypothetical protein
MPDEPETRADDDRADEEAPPPPTAPKRGLLRRVAPLARHTWVRVVAAAAGLLAVVGLLNATLDLWDRMTGGPPGSIEVGYETGESGRISRMLWHDGATACEGVVPAMGPHLFWPSGEVEQPGGGAVGTGYDQSATFTLSPLVHAQVVDIDPDDISRDVFLELGAYVAGDQEVRVILANRTEHQVVVTDMVLDVERRAAPSGTIMVRPGGDPTPLYVISFDLNETEPVARVIDDECRPAGSFFSQYAIVVEPGQVEVFVVELLAGDCLCLVRLHLEYWHDGEWKTLTIPEPPSDPIPVAQVSTERFGMVYIDNRSLSDNSGVEKYDCRREDHPHCAW